VKIRRKKRYACSLSSKNEVANDPPVWSVQVDPAPYRHGEIPESLHRWTHDRSQRLIQHNDSSDDPTATPSKKRPTRRVRGAPPSTRRRRQNGSQRFLDMVKSNYFQGNAEGDEKEEDIGQPRRAAVAVRIRNVLYQIGLAGHAFRTVPRAYRGRPAVAAGGTGPPHQRVGRDEISEGIGELRRELSQPSQHPMVRGVSGQRSARGRVAVGEVPPSSCWGRQEHCCPTGPFVLWTK
jgi:hypothetical protein